MNKLKDHISQKTQPSYEVSRKEKDSAIIFLLFTSEAELKFGKILFQRNKAKKGNPKCQSSERATRIRLSVIANI